MSAAKLLRLLPSESALLVCDMQEKFRLLRIVATEQNPSGLGHTVTELDLQKHKVPVFTKTKFSMCGPSLRNELGTGIKSVLICGIEAHVCVYHTAIDFQEQGFNVHVIVDGSSSRSMVDRLFTKDNKDVLVRIYGYKQLERAGINLSTSECVILGLVGDSAHEKFKAVQRLIKESAPDTGLLANISRV
uniref:Isochorismatase domain-containing protein 1 n=1 Tax=Meloidogyne hapla TaxID=6305 RepID=A0A1I8BY87_MELHA